MTIDFAWADIGTIGLLVFLEGILSVDNAVVLALLAARLPKELQRKALTYGIVGAIVFRFIALGAASWLMKMTWVKFVGGGYLIYVALAHFLKKEEKHDPSAPKTHASFWKTVATIELIDIAFAVDSILAAVAVSPKLWVVITGGVIGMILMRFAATVFIQILEKFPRFEQSAYFLVFLIGAKLVIDGFKIPEINFHSADSPASWIFWILMALCVAWGFKKKKAESN